MKAELTPVDDAAEASRREPTRRDEPVQRGLIGGQDLAVREAARSEAARPLRLFQDDTFERAPARRPLVSLGG